MRDIKENSLNHLRLYLKVVEIIQLDESSFFRHPMFQTKDKIRYIYLFLLFEINV